MPQLVKLQKEYKDQGFTIIASHAQNVEKEKVIAYLRSAKVNFTVVNHGSVDVPNKLEGIPAAYLFDAKGELVEAGRPAEMKNSIVELIKSEPHFLLEGRTFKPLKKYADALKHTAAYGSLLKKLEKEVESEGRAGKEARFLVKKITGYGEKKLNDARKMESVDALEALETYREVAAKWKGVDLGDKASERLKELKKDDTFQNELKAAALAARILAECDKLAAYGTNKPVLTSGPNKKVAATVKSYAAVLFKKYPESPVTERVKTELRSYGFDI